MKTIYIIFIKLKSLIKDNTFIFIMLCVGIFACNLIFTYFYGNIKYTVENADSTIYEIINETSSKTAKEVSFSFLKYDANVIFTSKCSSGETLPQKYKKQNIKGEDSFYIIYSIDQQAELVPYKISISIKSNLDEEIKKDLENTITSLYGENFIRNETSSFNWDFIRDILMLLLIYLSCIFSLLFIMAYIYEDFAYELNIYGIVGATKKKIIFIMCSIQFIILSVLNISAQIFHNALFDSFFYKISWSENVYYYLLDYIVVSLLTIVFTFAFIIVFLTIKTKKSVVLNKNNSIY